MAVTWKTLGQAKPAAGADADVYTVPTGGEALARTVTVCNMGDLTTYRIAVRPGGATLAGQHYVVYDAQVGGMTTDVLSVEMGMDAGTVVTVRSASGDVAFGVFGSEES